MNKTDTFDQRLARKVRLLVNDLLQAETDVRIFYHPKVGYYDRDETFNLSWEAWFYKNGKPHYRVGERLYFGHPYEIDIEQEFPEIELAILRSIAYHISGYLREEKLRGQEKSQGVILRVLRMLFPGILKEE